MPLLSLLKGRRQTKQTAPAPSKGDQSSKADGVQSIEANGRNSEPEVASTSGNNLSGALIFNGFSDFTVGRIVGTGSYGIVRIARHRATNTPVAIKVIHMTCT